MKISGPISVSVIQHESKYIILWGDLHGDKKGFCRCQSNNSKCTLLSSFLTAVKDKYDLFIESPWYSKDEKQKLVGKKFVNVNAISTMHNTFFEAMYFHEQHRNKHRVHFTDIRKEKSIRPLTHIIDSIDEILFGQWQIKDYSFVETLRQYTTVKRLHKFVNSLINNNNHKIFKQINKLSRDKQLLLKQFHRDICKQLIDTTHEYDYSHYQLYHVEKKTVDYMGDLAIIHRCLLLWLSHLKDIYTLARMLYFMNKSNVIMSYDGDYHTQLYNHFFVNYLHRTRHIWSFNKGKRCVEIPSAILQQIFPLTDV
jgi:hypothetical protein